MATIFPSDPVIDDVFEKWQWDGTVWKLIGTFDTGNALHIHNEDTTNVHGIPDTLAAFSLQTYSSSEPADPNIGDIWVESDIDVPTIDSSRFLRWRKTMVGGETSLSGNDDGSLALQYTPNYEQLYINGVLQVRGQDYLATTGNTITDITALSSGDTVEVFSAVALAVADVYTQSQADARYPVMSTTPVSGFRNVVMNGSFDIWQRGTTFTSPTGGTYTADRWRGGGSGASAGTFTFARTALGPTELPLTEASLTYYVKHTQTVAPSGIHNIEQRIENVRTFAGKTVTLSFYARLNSGTFPLTFEVIQSLGTGGSGSPATVTPTIRNSSGTVVTTATSSWARYYATFTIPSLSGMTIGTAGNDYLSLLWNQPASGTWNFDITGIQLEQGPVATPFEQIPIGAELALCQRYYYKIQPTVDGQWMSNVGVGRTSTEVLIPVTLPVTMRATPTIFTAAWIAVGDAVNTRITTPSGSLSSSSQPDIAVVSFVVSGATQYRPYVALNVSGRIGESFMAFEAEL